MGRIVTCQTTAHPVLIWLLITGLSDVLKAGIAITKELHAADMIDMSLRSDEIADHALSTGEAELYIIMAGLARFFKVTKVWQNFWGGVFRRWLFRRCL